MSQLPGGTTLRALIHQVLGHGHHEQLSVRGQLESSEPALRASKGRGRGLTPSAASKSRELTPSAASKARGRTSSGASKGRGHPRKSETSLGQRAVTLWTGCAEN